MSITDLFKKYNIDPFQYQYNELYNYFLRVHKHYDTKEDESVILFLLGRFDYYQKNYYKAKDYFIKALQLNNKDYYSVFYLARISEIFGNKITAMRLYLECLRLNSDFVQIQNYIIKLTDEIKYKDEEIEKALCTPNISSSKGKLTIAESFPKISIIILCHNNIQYTKKCLKSIFENTDYENYEIVILDNASVDETSSYLETFGSKIKFIHSDINLGFVSGNNYASNFAEGDYLVFLNNDTEVKTGWLNELYNTFVIFPDTGIAGSKLIYPNNILQEAGGIIFKDGSGWNYGRMQNPVDPRFNFVREVDYCSGASVMIKKEIFIKIGGFDNRFAPAYCEDSDLCFSIRQLGYKVRYNPYSIVVHFEGITAGKDINSGFKKYQKINTPKFYEKWKTVLDNQYENNPENVLQASNRSERNTILIIDDWPPLPDKASGTRRMYFTVKQMLALGYRIVYIHLAGKNIGDSAFDYLHELSIQGVEFIWFGYENWWEFRNSASINPMLDKLIEGLELKKRNPSLVYLSFWWVANYFIDRIRKEIPDTIILIDTHDIHYLREERQAELYQDISLKKQAKENKRKELDVYRKADCVTTVTEADREYLKRDLTNKAIFIMTNIHDEERTIVSFEERKDFIFVGNFNHTPNEDAVLYFVKEVFPLIKREIPDSKFYVVGNNPTVSIKELASNDIIVTGWVPEIKPFLEKCRVSVVPLRYGAGVKGKVGENFAHGLPTVMTSIGAEGMNIINGRHAFVADDPVQFAKYSVELYRDKKKWECISIECKKLIMIEYSSNATKKRLSYILSYYNRKSLTSYRALKYPKPPKVSIILVTYNQFSYTERCIKSIIKNTKVNHEIIIVDNGSTDNTIKELSNYPEIRLIKNQENLGFPTAVNQGINIAISDNILLLNNDTLVTDGWLEIMLEISESDSLVGIVGPISNKVSGIQLDKNANYEDLGQMYNYASEIRNKHANEIIEFPRLAFLCTLIKKEVIEKIGGLDERFSPGNYEDDDFCLRVQLAGYKSVIARSVFIHHFGSVSFNAEGNEKYLERLKTNESIFIKKWGAKPDEIWIKGQEITKRNINYPLNSDKFIQYFERALIHLEENEISVALLELEQAKINYYNSNRKGYENIEFPDLLNLIGTSYMLNQNLQMAKENFEEELKIIPTSSRACMSLGDVFATMEIFDSAKVMYEWAVKNDFNNKSAFKRLERVNIQLGLAKENNSLIEKT